MIWKKTKSLFRMNIKSISKSANNGETKMSIKELADKWRLENKRCVGGVIVFFDGDLCGWVNELRDPHLWRPGCIAIDEFGNQFKSVGGTAESGSHDWLEIT
jgi:hypothetical protein